MNKKKIRILIAKPGLDGHDRGAKTVALALRDAGFEVIYSGLHQDLDQIINTAVQESVDIIGMSIMSGAHLPICRELINQMKTAELSDTFVVVGGVIPTRDIEPLKAMGIQGVFPGGTPFEEIVQTINSLYSVLED